MNTYFNGTGNNALGETSLLLVFHEKTFIVSKFALQIKQLLDPHFSTAIYDEKTLRDPYHSIALKRFHGYPIFIVNFALRNAGEKFRSDATIAVDCSRTYQDLLYVFNEVYKQMFRHDCVPIVTELNAYLKNVTSYKSVNEDVSQFINCGGTSSLSKEMDENFVNQPILQSM